MTAVTISALPALAVTFMDWLAFAEADALLVGQYKSCTDCPVMAHLQQPNVQPGAKLCVVGQLEVPVPLMLMNPPFPSLPRIDQFSR